MVCEEKTRPVDAYSAATLVFAKAMQELRRNIGTSSDYKRLRRAPNDTRVKAEQARLALEQHNAAHRC
jgi:hypothetical protein